MKYAEVLNFWFETLSPKDWWRKSEKLDAQITEQFLNIHEKVAQGKSKVWRDTDEGRLAEIIVLDQFSRNMFRDQAASFAYDVLALDLCKEAVKVGAHTRLERSKTSFLLMPYMHSESLAEHQAGLPLFKQYCSENTVEFELRHAKIIQRFGRYPHRNLILGRDSTQEEIAFLNEAGSGF